MKYEYRLFTMEGCLMQRLNDLGDMGWIVIQPISTKTGQGSLPKHKIICIRIKEN